MLLNLPKHPREVINDNDGLVVNTLRALQHNPSFILEALQQPVSEIDYQAHLLNTVDNPLLGELRERLIADLNYYDEPLALSFIYANTWQLGHYKKGPWKRTGNTIACEPNNPKPGICRSRPKFSHRAGLWSPPGELTAEAWLQRIQERMRDVLILNSDWAGTITPAMLGLRRVPQDMHVLVFLDPPYEGTERAYRPGNDIKVSDKVRAWCIEQTDTPRLDMILCGYREEHDDLLQHGWVKTIGKANGSGYRTPAQRKSIRHEKVWWSPGLAEIAHNFQQAVLAGANPPKPKAPTTWTDVPLFD